MIEITLPWPDKALSPNARVHWARKAKAAAMAKNTAYALAHQFRNGDISGELFAFKLIFHPPDKRKRDIDNLISSGKNYWDGICLALNIDDSQLWSVTGTWGEVRKPGAVTVRLEAM